LFHLLLLLVTFSTVTFTGALYANERVDSWLGFFLSGWVFSLPLMTILVVHELGHYLAGRRWHLAMTLPYFLPSVPPIGTFGAFIRVLSPFPDRRALMEVGSWGPLAGSLVAIPLLIVGLMLSEMRPETTPQGGALFNFGSSIILELVCLLRFGEFSFNATVILHPTAMAAWFGLFVTSMNLLPMGQLDGGHVVYALFGPRVSRNIGYVTLGSLAVMGVALWPGWLVFGALTVILGLRHPYPLDVGTPLETRQRVMGWLALVLLVICFIPVPITVVE
jgi:membrane-associated protease RseP (regulator of RpoE activity)